jgi:hypothetical protein
LKIRRTTIGGSTWCCSSLKEDEQSAAAPCLPSSKLVKEEETLAHISSSCLELPEEPELRANTPFFNRTA